LSINDNYTKSIVGYNSLVAGSVRPVIEPTQTTIAQYGATQAEKTTWNNKSDFSGDYDDLTNKPTIPAAQI